MERFEEAVQVVFFQQALRSQAERERQERAQVYLDEILAAPEGWAHLLQWLPALASVEARFWTLQALLNTVFPSSSPQQRQTIREGILTHCILRRLRGSEESGEGTASGDSAQGPGGGSSAALCEGRSGSRAGEERGTNAQASAQREDAAVKNKTALLIVRLLQIDFPSTWPSAFLELRRLLTIAVEATTLLPSPTGAEKASAHSPRALAVLDGLDTCLRILLLLHQEIVEDPFAPPEAEQARRDAEIRAGLRQHFSSSELSAGPSDGACVSFSRLLLQLLQLPTIRQDAALLRLTCELIGRYIGYMDLLLPPSTREAVARSQSGALGRLGSSAHAEGETRPTTAVGDADGDGEIATEGTLVHLLLETWLACSCEEASNAVVAFAHKKMEAETKARLLSRMGLAEALRACTQQVAQRPELVAGFASMVNTAASAFLEAAHALKQREKEGLSPCENSRNGATGPGGEETQACGQRASTEKQRTGCGKDTSRAALMAWHRVSLLLPVIVELFACPVMDIAFRVEPFLSLFCNKTRFQRDPQKGSLADRRDEALGGALPSDFSTSQSLAPFLTNMLQLLYQKLASQLYKRVFLVHQVHAFSWLQEMTASVCNRLSLSEASAVSPSLTSLPSSGLPGSLSSTSSPLPAEPSAALWRELGAALHLLLLSAEHVKDLSREMKDLTHCLPACLLSLLQTNAVFRFSALPPPHVRLQLLAVLGRFAPFFSHHPEYLPTALQLLLGPAFLNLSPAALSPPEPKRSGARLARLQRRLACVASRSCLSLLRFLKNTQPQVNAFTVDILHALQSENCLQIPLPSPAALTLSRGAFEAARDRASEVETTGAALVPNKLFSVDDQQLLFEAAGVLLGARNSGGAAQGLRGPRAQPEADGQADGCAPNPQKAEPRRGLSQEEKIRLLHQLLQHLVPAFDTTKLSKLSSPEEAACWALLWARTCNAIASLTKAFPSCAGEGRESSAGGDRTREVWKEAFQHISYATQVALSPSSLRPELRNVILFSPFFHSFVFLLRRGLHLLSSDILPVMHATLPLLYEALPSPLSSSRALEAPERLFLSSSTACTPSGACGGAAPCTPQGCGAQLASLVTYFLVTLKEKSLVAHGGFLSEDLLRNIFWRHFTLWWRAETESPEFLRDQAELQEQLSLLLSTVGKEVPALLAGFLAADPVSSSACVVAANSLASSVVVDLAPAAPPSLSVLTSFAFRNEACRDAFVRNLQECQRVFSLATPEASTRSPPFYLSLGQGVIASGLPYSDLRNIFLSELHELFTPSAPGSARLREDISPLHAARVGVSCFLLFSISSASARNSVSLMNAIHAWFAALQHVFDALPLAAWPHLQQVQTFFSRHTRDKQPQDGAVHAAVPSPDVQEKAADEVMRLLPVREIFTATSALILQLDVAADAQQARVLGDVCCLWRLFVLGPGGTVASCSPPSRQNGVASSLFALASVLPHFFQPLQRLLFSSLSDALYGFVSRRKETGAGIARPEKLAEDASQAAATLVQNLVQTADLRASKENVRQWVLAQRQAEK
ncbi:conserved hypothetical protein [Neospora caninum Liverpool]|uniref:Exportin-T n=1 Tax=Neospora caninum (strain Liverpool) TaxID=572307 RepID=F0VL10_NEOCL|nr:conserved hypothetical protein [Neospora caninum Liverpool]CBZ54762.1 conserved hypothetical protein [Neospora caninum Liverpool]|eukprot:XP_003884790.1 conserved hypothetical protein [Neospora caninum Liverpool]